jgi:hypothetical protein
VRGTIYNLDGGSSPAGAEVQLENENNIPVGDPVPADENGNYAIFALRREQIYRATGKKRKTTGLFHFGTGSYIVK